MKKIILFIPFTLLFILAIIFTNEKNNISNSQGYKDNKEINALLSEYSVENGHGWVPAFPFSLPLWQLFWI